MYQFIKIRSKRKKLTLAEMKRKIDNLNKPAEVDVEGCLKSEIRKLKGECPKIVNPGEAGWPDRKALLPGGFEYWVEVKKESGVLSKMQEIVHRRLATLGITVYVLYSKADVDEFIKMVKNDIKFS